MISKFKTADIDYTLFTISKIDSLAYDREENFPIFESMLKTFLEKSNILTSIPTESVQVIRKGLILPITFDIDEHWGHELFICIDKYKDGSYFIHVCDNLSSESYVNDFKTLDLHSYINSVFW